MKRTLFNTLMGCLAALSLAGCGGSGSSGGSSTMPSESLISEGYSSVHLQASSGKYSYYYVLNSDGTCLFYPHYAKAYTFKGSWTAEFLGAGESPESGKFNITFGAFSPAAGSLELKCTIDHTSEITLTIDDMIAYRAATAPVDASFDKAPYTHQAGAGCPDTSSVGTGLNLQMH